MAEVGARAVSRSVRSRLARLPRGAGDVARVVAVLGEGARLPAVAALAGMTEAERRPRQRPPSSGPTSCAPTARSASSTRSSARPSTRSCRGSSATGATPRRPASCTTSARRPRRSRCTSWSSRRAATPGPRTSCARRGAGRSGRGAIESALAHLRRALAEPPPPGDRAPLLLELGAIERDADAPAAAEHLRAAYAELEDPRDRATAAELLEWALCFLGPPDQAVRVMEEALADLPAGLEDERRAIEALGRFTAYWYGLPADDARWAELRAAPPEGDGAGTKMLLAATAWQWAVSDGPADRCVELALRAFAGGTLLEHDPSLMSVAAGSVLTMADHAESLTPWDTLRTRADTHGGATVTVAVQLWRGWALARRGELEEAEASLREALAGQVLWGLGAEVRAYTVGLAAETLLERGDVAGVRALIDGAVEPPPGSDLRTFLEIGRAQLALAEGDLAAAVAATDGLGASPIENPAWVPWRSARALALHGLGRDGEAVALAWEDLGFAKRWGAPGAHRPRAARARHGGGGGRPRASPRGGRDARRLAVPARAREGPRGARRPPPARRPHGRRRHPAARRRRAGRRMWRRAARRLRPRPPGGSRDRRPAGPAPLTALERRVAALAAEGVDANGVAQALFLTPAGRPRPPRQRPS